MFQLAGLPSKPLNSEPKTLIRQQEDEGWRHGSSENWGTLLGPV